MTALDDDLAEVKEEILDEEYGRPRSSQKEVGWSEVGGCRAYMGYRIRGTVPSDDVDESRAVLGTALHAWFGPLRQRAAERKGRYIVLETEVEYGGIPGHADEIDLTRGIVTDYKFPSLAAAANWEDPDLRAEKFVQPQGYAAAVAGSALWRENVTPEILKRGPLVRALIIPVDGSLDDYRLYEMPFDRSVADRAVARLLDVQEAVVTGAPLPQDKPWHFCEKWCEFFSLCRGGTEPDHKDLPEIADREIAAAIDRYGEASEQYLAAEKAKKLYRPLIAGARGRTGLFKVSTGNGGSADVADMDQIRADYEASGIDLPMKKSLRAGALRVTRL